MKRTMRSLLALLTACFVFAGPVSGVLAGEPEPAAVPAAVKPAPSPAPPDYRPSAVADELGRFLEAATQYEAEIAEWRSPETLTADIRSLEEKLTKAEGEFRRRKGLSSWELKAAGEFKLKLKPVFDEAAHIRGSYLGFLKTADTLIAGLQDERDYFRRFLSFSSGDATLSGTRQMAAEAAGEADRLISAAKRSRAAFTKAFQDHSDPLQRTSVLEKDIKREIRLFRRSQFKKTAPAFFEPEFFVLFDAKLAGELRLGWRTVTDIDWEWVRANNHRVAHVMLVFAVLLPLFLRLRHRPEWGVVFAQPVGLSLAGAVIVTGFGVTDAAPALAVLYWLLLCSLLLMLVRVYPMPAWQRTDIGAIILTYGLLQVTDTVGLPLPIFRIEIAVLAVLLAVYLARRRWRVASEEGGKAYAAVARLLIPLFGLAAVAEILGYHLFAAMFVRGAVKSLFLAFAFWNIRFLAERLVSGAMEAGLDRLSLGGVDRSSLRRRIAPVLHVTLAYLALAALATVWGIADGLSPAVEGLWNAGFSWHDRRLTLGMILGAAFIAYAVIALASVVCHVLEREFYPRRGISEGNAKSINGLITYGAWVVGLAGGFTVLGFNLNQLAIIAGALSVGIGFGLQTIVNNFVSGLILLFERPVKAGDVIVVGEHTGTVEKVGLRSTIVRSPTQSQLIIPNSDFVTRMVENLTFSDSEARVTVSVGAAYGSDVERVKAILVAVCSGHRLARKHPAPEAYFTGFGDSAMNFEACVWTDDIARRRELLSDVLGEVDLRFRAEGIEIPFPQRDVRIRSAVPGMEATFPASRR